MCRNPLDEAVIAAGIEFKRTFFIPEIQAEENFKHAQKLWGYSSNLHNTRRLIRKYMLPTQ